MRLPRFEYVKAKTIEEAVSAIAQANRKAKLLAGGTDLLVNMKYGVVCPETVVSIKHLARALRRIFCQRTYGNRRLRKPH